MIQMHNMMAYQVPHSLRPKFLKQTQTSRFRDFKHIIVADDFNKGNEKMQVKVKDAICVCTRINRQF